MNPVRAVNAPDPAARRRRSRAVAAPMVAALALATSGCGSSNEARGVCRDQRTDTRVDDRYCRTGGTGFGWWYFGSGLRYPAVGQRVSTVSGARASAPSGSKVVLGGAKASGGSVAKGGFGGSGSGKGVGG